MYLTFLVTRFI